MTIADYVTYDEFWPGYLRAHSKPMTRAVHFAGTALAVLFGVAWLMTFATGYLVAAVVTPYLFAWASHVLIQHNKPVSFQYPIWSLVSGARMFALWLSGGLAAELVKAGVPADAGV
jgi:hypothetical protein